MEIGEESDSVRESNTATNIAIDADYSMDVGDEGSSGKRKLTSDVWDHFERTKSGQVYYAICKYCKARLSANSVSGTSNLWKHYNQSCKKKPGKTDSRQKRVCGSQEVETHIFSQEDSRKKLAEMVILHDYPLSIVHHIGFRKFATSLQPCFKMISRNTLKNDILSIYEFEKKKCYNILEKLSCRIAITTDMWTSNNTKKGFMAITAHYIDDSWSLKSCILRFAYVPAPHNAEAISDVLFASLMDWNIDRKVSTITVDNATTNDAMLNLLIEKLSRPDLPLDGKVLHLRCCAHILNLIVRDGLEIIAVAIEKIRDSIAFWTASAARIEKFEEAASQLRVDCTRKLILDCRTRWNSTYLMLETAIEYRQVFSRLYFRESKYKSLPTEEEWRNATEICEKLKIFYDVTEMFSGTLYPTSSFYFSKICDIKLQLDDWVDSTNEMIHSMAEKMLEKYNKYWNTCHVLMGVAAVLDPRFKLHIVEFYFEQMYNGEEGARPKVNEIRQNCYDLLADYKARDVALNENRSNVSGGSSGSTAGVSCTSIRSNPMQMFDRFLASKGTPTTVVSLTSELDMYLGESVLPRVDGDGEFDILSWWKTNGVKYPTLQKMAKDILAIPVSTVASESAFSCSGRLITPHRSRLHPTTLEALMCARRWLWNDNELKGISPISFDDEEEEEENVEECTQSETLVNLGSI